MKKTMLILGGTGMLGNAVGKYFQQLPDYEVWLTARDKSLAYGSSNWISYDPTGKTGETASLTDVFAQMPKNPDYVICAIGTIKPFMDQNPRDAIYINSVLPHELAATCCALGVKMIHVSSDCVYSGSVGKYVESDLHDALDAYGKSKSLGETKECMVIRTSILGEEIHKNASLVAWAKSQAGKRISGFTNHIWNGITTKQFANCCHQIIEKDLYETGLHHVFSNDVTKLELLSMIDARFGLNLTIAPVEAGQGCDRTMRTNKDLMSKLTIPSISDQIKDM